MDGGPLTGTRFDRATAARPLAPGRFAVTIDDGWSAPVGPNGGYVAAIVLRAMLAAMDRPERVPRSLTLHYLRRLVPGDAVVEATEERAGRALSTMGATIAQGDRRCVLALGAFAPDYPLAAAYGTPPPAAPAPADVAAPPPPPDAPAIVHRFDMRPTLGPAPFSAGDEALTGGWLRFAEPRALDALGLAMYTDAWWPSPWTRLDRLSPAPTIDLTIHFRNRVELGPEEHVLARFVSRTAAEGFFEEDGEIWAPDGTLLAQSRQLALLPPAG